MQLKIVAKQKRPEIYLGFSYAQKEVVIHMASRIQGITVEIGGDTTKLSKALESVNKSIKGTQSGLKDVNKLLKLDLSNEKPERYPCGLPCGAARIIMGIVLSNL